MYDGGVLDELEGVLDKLCAAEPAALGDAESILALHRGLARLEAVVTRASAAFDANREWDVGGARSAAGWLAATCRLPQAAARRRGAPGSGPAAPAGGRRGLAHR